MTSVIAMPAFQNVFNCGTEGETVSVIFSLYTVCVLPSGSVAALYGYR